jgi:hypothetical protein
MPAYIDTLNVVRKGSVGLNVMGCLPAGRGSLMTSSRRWFCQKHSPQAITRTATHTISRMRSSSRCSTSVSDSSYRAVRSRATTLRPLRAHDLVGRPLGPLT